MAPGFQEEWHKSASFWGVWDWALAIKHQWDLIFFVQFCTAFGWFIIPLCINYYQHSDWCSYFTSTFGSKQPANCFWDYGTDYIWQSLPIWTGVILAHKNMRAEGATQAEPGGSSTPLNPIVSNTLTVQCLTGRKSRESLCLGWACTITTTLIRFIVEVLVWKLSLFLMLELILAELHIHDLLRLWAVLWTSVPA